MKGRELSLSKVYTFLGLLSMLPKALFIIVRGRPAGRGEGLKAQRADGRARNPCSSAIIARTPPRVDRASKAASSTDHCRPCKESLGAFT